MEISTAQKKDYTDITKLYYGLYPTKKDQIKYFNGVNLESKIFIARENDKAIGFILTTFVSYAKSRAGYIEELFVVKDSRNTGVGKSLVNMVVNWQRTMNSEVIFVTTDEAQEFYKKSGFKELGKNSWLCLPL